MFGDVKKTDGAALWAGVNSAASLIGRRLVWVVAHGEGENNRWSRALDLPERVRAGDIASVCPSVYGITLVTRDGSLHVFDGQRNGWDARGVVDGVPS
jgi:hypothetical protein